MKHITTGKKEDVWDLSTLYRGADDPRLARDLRFARNKAIKFVSLYKGKMTADKIDASMLLDAIKEYELIHELGMKPYLFASLFYASDTQDDTKRVLLEKIREDWNIILQNILFFPLEIMQLPETELNKIAGHEKLSEYRHFFSNLLRLKPHQLSEAEEKIIKLKNLSGRDSLISFFTEYLGSVVFPFKTEEGIRGLTAQEILKFLYSADADLRETSYTVFLEILGKHSIVFKNILNSILLDYRIETEKRNHPFPMHRALLENEVSKETIDTLMGVTEDNYSLAHRYFCFKARQLNLTRLKNTDLFAPLNRQNRTIPFTNARGLILRALQDFHPAFHENALKFFENRWIDAEMRKGKKEGAFCASFVPRIHPYISVHFGSNLQDVMTLAHELGHGIHFLLASKQSYLNFSPAFVLGESISTLAELIVTIYLMKNEEFKTWHSSILAAHIETFITTVFRQNVLTRFEQTMHHIRKTRILGTDEICRIWWEENKKLFGDIVTMIPAYKWGWTYIHHFIQYPFYCFTYIFGGVLSHVLYRTYLTEGEQFAEKILFLMEAGGSREPLDLLSQIGIDLTDKSFWEKGFELVREMIDTLEGAQTAPPLP